MSMRTQNPSRVENHPHRYADCNGACARLECGRDENDAIHQTSRDEDIVSAALDYWASGENTANANRARELARKLRTEGGLAV